jgi:hypothetical protein
VKRKGKKKKKLGRGSERKGHVAGYNLNITDKFPDRN